MRRLPFLVLLVLVFIEIAPTDAQKKADGSAMMLPVSQSPYRVGEHLTYNVTFANFINAAHVEVLVAARGTFFNREGIQLRSHVETTGVINAALYAINNDYTSYIDPASGQPYRAQQIIQEGGRTSDTSNDYNLPLGAEAIPPKRSGVFPGTYDFLSALYRLRALPLTEGATYSFTAQSGSTQYDAELKVLGREMVKTNVGSFNAIATQVRTAHSSQINDLRLRIYFSDDERHVPVLITAKHRAGDIRADLAGSEFVDVNGVEAPTKDTPPVTPRAVAPLVLPSSPSPQPPLGLPFDVGEQLNYNVYLGDGVQPVGVASFQVKSKGKYHNQDGLMLTTNARTNGVVARVFTANDQINSYVDPTTLLPFRTELQLQEGSRRTNQVLTFDQDRGTASTDKGQRIDIPVGTHDVLSVLYALRSFNLNPPKRNAVSILVNDRPMTLFVTSLKREKIQINGQSISAVQLSLTTDDPESDKFAFRMWVGDDRRRIPLRVTASTPVGSIRADLAIIPVSQQ